jgi:hypothetical protein
MPQAKRIHIDELNIPDYTGTASTIIGKHILFVTIQHDQDCSNPIEDDGFGEIRSLSRRHINNIDYDEALELLKTDEDVIPLSYFEHGNSLWMVQNSSAPAGVEFQWDGVRFAGVWIPDDCVRESYMGQDGLSRRDWMVKQAASACETYTQWANGDCYGYSIEAYKLRKEDGDVYEELEDYRYDTAIYEDSCWGFIGSDYMRKDEVIPSVRNALSAMGFSKRAIAAAIESASV